ncbi:hypothetical protein [Tsukamurella paurometabola]|uniref:Uncharacterized protein n=1 Tax=Tsukamurella paurometabola TaxID=2061 RepID=A0A3P8MED8_TSUPA|nr:hypothetical protein [Tsukamurella paurometabola]UEA82942.1 hypothetical protein LK411_21710 [Tsukamurella paurometabola]VDR40023.1 Uncharacterised protein [Tsukamurella paurometabola]
MLWPHRIRVTYSIPFDPPQYNEDGNEIYDEVDKVVPGQVVPVTGGTRTELGHVYDETRYQMMLAPTLNLPLSSTPVQYEWKGITLDAAGPAERHMLGGRLHHYEVMSAKLT